MPFGRRQETRPHRRRGRRRDRAARAFAHRRDHRVRARRGARSVRRRRDPHRRRSCHASCSCRCSCPRRTKTRASRWRGRDQQGAPHRAGARASAAVEGHRSRPRVRDPPPRGARHHRGHRRRRRPAFVSEEARRDLAVLQGPDRARPRAAHAAPRAGQRPVRGRARDRGEMAEEAQAAGRGRQGGREPRRRASRSRHVITDGGAEDTAQAPGGGGVEPARASRGRSASARPRAEARTTRPPTNCRARATAAHRSRRRRIAGAVAALDPRRVRRQPRPQVPVVPCSRSTVFLLVNTDRELRRPRACRVSYTLPDDKVPDLDRAHRGRTRSRSRARRAGSASGRRGRPRGPIEARSEPRVPAGDLRITPDMIHVPSEGLTITSISPRVGARRVRPSCRPGRRGRARRSRAVRQAAAMSSPRSSRSSRRHRSRCTRRGAQSSRRCRRSAPASSRSTATPTRSTWMSTCCHPRASTWVGPTHAAVHVTIDEQLVTRKLPGLTVAVRAATPEDAAKWTVTPAQIDVTLTGALLAVEKAKDAIRPIVKLVPGRQVARRGGGDRRGTTAGRRREDQPGAREDRARALDTRSR